MNLKVALALVAVAVSASPAAFAGEPSGRRFGDTQVLVSIPNPGFPEGVVVEGTTAFVSGPATFGTAGQGPSQIHAIDTRSGEQLSSIVIEGEDLSQDHALSSMTSDGEGRLYVLSTQLGVVRVDPRTGEQEIYATIPHLQACNELPPGPCLPPPGGACLVDAPAVSCDSGRCLPPGPCAPGLLSCLPPGPCAPVAFDRGSLPNDLAFDDEGNLYITDSLQATIFRVKPGSREAEAFFQSPAFDTSTIPGFSLGFNGLRLTPDRSHLVFTVTFGPNAGVWKVPRITYPPSYTLQLVKGYNNYELPDGIAFGAGGRLYVALAGTNQIGALIGSWEFVRWPAASANAVLPVPFDAPANIAFNGRGSLVVTNHALFTGPGHAALLDTVIFDTASPLARPALP